MIIPISQFATMGYCEYLPVLIFLKRAKPVRRRLEVGRRQHQRSQEEDSRNCREVRPERLLKGLLSRDSCIEMPSEGIRVGFGHRGYFFLGQPDKVTKRGEKIVVTDEKFVRRSYGRIFKDREYQLSAYCHGLKSGSVGYALGSKTLWLGKGLLKDYQFFYRIVERDRLTREILYESMLIPFGDRFNELLQRFTDIIGGRYKKETLINRNPGKCKACSFRLACYGR